MPRKNTKYKQLTGSQLGARFGLWPDPDQQATRLMNRILERGGRFLGRGATRSAFASPDGKWVYKIQHRTDAEHNASEAAIYKRTGGKLNDMAFARCRLLKDNVLVMEALEGAGVAGDHPALKRKDVPRWVFTFDHGQCALNRKGDWVAWDYCGWEDVLWRDEKRNA